MNSRKKDIITQDLQPTSPDTSSIPHEKEPPLIRTFEIDTATAQGKKVDRTFSITRPQKEAPATTPEPPQDRVIPLEVDPSLIPASEVMQAPTLQEGRDFSKKEEPQEEAPTSPLHKPVRKSIVRTYEDDTAQALKDKKATVVSIALEEQKKREERAQKDTQRRKVRTKQSVLSILSVLFVICALGVLGYVYALPRFLQKEPPVAIENISHVFTEQEQSFDITHLGSSQIRQELSFLGTQQLLQGFTHVDIIKTHAEGDITTTLRPTSYELFEFFSPQIPRSLMRAFEDRFTLAYNSDGSTTIPVLVVSIDSFDSAFAGMLRWETSMIDDLVFLFPARAIGQSIQPQIETTSTTIASSTSTTTLSSIEEEVSTTTPRTIGFYDLIIDNKDTRAIEDSRGNIRLIYSFPDTKTLVITNDIPTLREVFKRLERKSLTR